MEQHLYKDMINSKKKHIQCDCSFPRREQNVTMVLINFMLEIGELDQAVVSCLKLVVFVGSNC